MQATEKYLKRFADIKDEKRRTYAAMMSRHGRRHRPRCWPSCGDGGLEENTLIFFVSDNGGPTRSNGSSNGPLRGVKGRRWRAASACRSWCSGRASCRPARSYDQPVIQLDILPTALAAAGVDGRRPMEARRRQPAAVPRGQEGRGAARRPVLAVRRADGHPQGDWKLVAGARVPNGKKLFNLADDIGEKNDLSAAEPGRSRRCRPRGTTGTAATSRRRGRLPVRRNSLPRSPLAALA